jgi:hypothetical protein
MDPLRATVERALGNQYEVLNLIGRGGMGAVYLARERFLERLVAVKVLPHDSTGDGSGRERFLREARTAARLSHPSIVPLHTFAEAEGTLLYVMGFVAGESLETRLAREGKLPAADATRIMSEIADALHYAHSMGVVHRDVKPDNILLDGQTGRAFLTDFGIAKQGAQQSLTRTGMVVGTPHYMSPEQGSGDPTVDGRSDLYALGVIGYRMVSGRLPFDAPGFQELLMQHATREPSPLEQSPTTSQIAGVIARCLRKQPDERWQSGSAIVEALRPREAHELDLPDELSSLPSSGLALIAIIAFTEIVLGIMHLYKAGTLDLLPSLLVPVLGTAGFVGSYALQARRHSRPMRELATIAFWAPSWWAGWWPRRLRRPGDIWDQLPKTIRTVRGLMTFATIMMTGFALPAMVLTFGWWATGNVPMARSAQAVYVPVTALGFGALFLGLAMTVPWGKRFGLAKRLTSRLMTEPTWNNPFWKRPEVAQLLEVGPSATVTTSVNSPTELVAAIDRSARALPEPLRVVGEQAAGAAHGVLRFIDNVDREMAALAREADPAERAQLERKLTSLPTSEGPAAPRSQMRELVEQQLALFEQLEGRRRQLGEERDRSIGMLRSLHLQLANSRAQLARDEGSVTELSGQIRAICADLEGGRTAMTEVERILAPKISTPNPV